MSSLEYTAKLSIKEERESVNIDDIENRLYWGCIRTLLSAFEKTKKFL